MGNAQHPKMDAAIFRQYIRGRENIQEKMFSTGRVWTWRQRMPTLSTRPLPNPSGAEETCYQESKGLDPSQADMKLHAGLSFHPFIETLFHPL